jgi:ABC-type transporter Mla maintaining outer membrane lipid asymmetry ATPase subunit MlaF
MDRPRPAAVAPWIAPGEPIISIRGVSKSFGSHTVLEDITFDVPKGRITAILGPSGTGKSVLLKNILGLLRPERGEIWVDGDQIVGLRERRLYEVRKKFGVLFQDGALFGSMNLYDNIAFPLREHTRKNEAQIRELVHRNAELVGLMDHLRKLPGEVSGGMKKRAGLARAMVTEPRSSFSTSRTPGSIPSAWPTSTSWSSPPRRRPARLSSSSRTTSSRSCERRSSWACCSARTS